MLTRWLFEVHPGVFVGTISSRVRDGLWRNVTGARRLGACTLIVRSPNEQGFTIQTAGDGPTRCVLDYDGLQLLGHARTQTPQANGLILNMLEP
jgi:CRISPR-associated protein Cas2